MRPFTLAQFRKLNWEIPNLPSDKYRIVDLSGEDAYGRHYQDKQYQVRGSELAIDSSYSVDINEWYPIFRISRSGWIRDYNSSLAQACGLVKVTHSWDGELAVIDGLYYKFNPVVLHHKNGNLKKGVLSCLKKRLDSDRWSPSCFTHTLLQAFASSLPEESDRDRLYDTLRAHNLRVFKCFLTNDILPSYYARWFEFSEGTRACGSRLNPLSYGYHREAYTNGGSVYLTADEVLVQDAVYLRSQVNMCHCPQCNTEVPDITIIDGACIKCNESRYKIHNYSTKAPSLLKFKATKVKPSTIYLGIELEYESTNRELAKVKVGKALYGHAIMKSDGSINNGFEIVTCPATLDIHLEEFKKFYSDFPKELHPDKNTGMHVHVSRKPLNIFTIGKMTEFLNRIDNKPFLKYIAGRIDNSYAKIDSRTVTYPFTIGDGRGERYNALNLNNSDTVEFRIFSTPKDWEEFSARLEFVQALTDYCQPCQVNAPLKEQTSSKTFLQWLGLNRKSYPEFSNYMKGYSTCG